MSTATLALRHSEADKPNRALPDDCEPFAFDDQDLFDAARSLTRAVSTAQVSAIMADIVVMLGALKAEAYNAGRLDGLLAMGGDRGLQS